MELAPIASDLVVTFTQGVSLLDWERSGLLEREWAIYERLRSHYARILLVTWGGEQDRAIAARLRAEVVLWEIEGLRDLEHLGREVVVKTNQMFGGHVAMEIVAAVRRRDGRAALIARGGYPWSRFMAWERGSASRSAAEAAAREGELCRAADLVVGTTASMVEDLCWRYGLPETRSRVIPNYVDLGNIAVQAAAAPARAAGGQVEILFAGRLVEQKRVDRVIDAIRLLPRQLKSQVVLRIVGEGPLEAALRARAADAGIEARFGPRRPHGELMEIMSGPGIYCQASDYEGHPKTVLEAMGCGRATVVTDVPGMRDVVKDARTGLVTGKEPREIAGALELLVSQPEVARALGEAAASEVRERYGLERIVELEIQAHRAAMKMRNVVEAAGV